MIRMQRVLSVETHGPESFEDRVDILFRELELAVKWQRPSLLLAIYGSEFMRADAEAALENCLAGLDQRVYRIKIKEEGGSGFNSLVTELANLKNVVLFIDGLRWAEQEDNFEIYRSLNKQREFFIENRVRIIFWLTESEAVDFAHYAPDCWGFRHRVIEFTDPPPAEQISLRMLESAWQGAGEPNDPVEELDAKIAIRTALLTDLPEGNESTGARANLLLTLGMLHWRRGDNERAAQLLDSALNLAANLEDDCFEALCYNAMALVDTDLGRYDEAIRAYQRVIKLAPERICPWNNLGNLYAKLGQYETALKAFQTSVEHNPNDSLAWNGLGTMYQKTSRSEDAIYAFMKAVELAPTDASAWHSLGELNASQGRLEDALQAYQTAVNFDPCDAAAWNDLGNLYHESGPIDKAIQAYQAAVDLDIPCSHPYGTLASIYTRCGNNAKAVPLLQKAIDLADDPTDKQLLWNRLGDAFRRLGEYDNAIAAYRNADGLDPVTSSEKEESRPDSDSRIAGSESGSDIHATSTRLPQDQSDGAESSTQPVGESGCQSDDDFAEWLEVLGKTLPNKNGTGTSDQAVIAEMGEDQLQSESPSPAADNPEAGIPCWVFKADPDEQPARDGSTEAETSPLYLGGRILSGDLIDGDAVSPRGSVIADSEDEKSSTSQVPLTNEVGRNTVQTQEEIDSKNAQIWNELGNIYLKTGAHERASHAFNKAIELDPYFGWPYNNLALICVHKGQYAEAIPLYLKGVSLLNKAVEKALIWNRMGDAYRRLNDPENAMAAYQKARELDPGKESLLDRARLSLLGNCRV